MDEEGAAYGLDALALLRVAVAGDRLTTFDHAARIIFGYEGKADAVALATVLVRHTVTVLQMWEEATGRPAQEWIDLQTAGYLIPDLEVS